MSLLREMRERAGITQGDLAALANTSQPQINRLELGERKLTKQWAERLAPHLRVQPVELLFGPDAGQLPRLPTMQQSQLTIKTPIEALGDRDFPVYSAAEGGAGEMVVSTDPIEIVQRPWFMREVSNGYAVLVVGESMIPVFQPGDMAIVNPRLPPMRNKNAIFISDEEGGEFRAIIKHLTNWDKNHWRVRQYNELKEFDLNKKEWPKALRVVGKYEGG